MEVWKKMHGMSNPVLPHSCSYLQMTVDGSVEILGVVTIEFLSPR